MSGGFVYIMSNIPQLVRKSIVCHGLQPANSYCEIILYTGVTNDLARRVEEHKLGVLHRSAADVVHFSARYCCDKLVYFEEFPDIVSAISRETQLKNWKRRWKLELITSFNPKWYDLSRRLPSS